jgi:hypothetical protein
VYEALARARRAKRQADAAPRDVAAETDIMDSFPSSHRTPEAELYHRELGVRPPPSSSTPRAATASSMRS